VVDIEVDGKIILKWKALDQMEWIYLVQDRDQWWALVNTVMKLWNIIKGGGFFTI
jgi:hypothetical protein